MWLIDLAENHLSVTRLEEGRMNLRMSTDADNHPHGTTAIMDIASHTPDIVLLDLGLPDMDCL